MTVVLQGAMGQVPGLLAQTVVPSSAVHDLLLDPGNQLRCAFHLGCGWSGTVVCMQAGHAAADCWYDLPGSGGPPCLLHRWGLGGSV